jgi:sialic acid synthase SpsE
MLPTIRIGRREIGPHAPAYLVAEIGYNFESDFELAKRMTVEAARAGADAVKFQTFEADKLVTRSAPIFWDVATPGATQYEDYAACKPLSMDQYRELAELAQAHGAVMFSTPFDEESADLLEQLDVPAYKIASMDMPHLPLLRHVARKKKPMMVATGAGTLEEIGECVEAVTSQGNDELILLHCITNYPCKNEDAHLRMMLDIQKHFPKVLVGYSDHTIPDKANTVPVAAVAMGATVIEKHFSLDRARAGEDHALSGEPNDFASMAESFRIIHQAKGLCDKAPAPSESRAVQFARRSLVARRAIAPGKTIAAEDIIILRPSTGIKPKHLDDVIGRTANQSIPEDTVLQWEMVE